MATEKMDLKELLQLASQLPEEQQLELIAKLASRLRARNVKNVKKKEESPLDPSNDPIMRIIGISEVEPFSHNLDEQLYGE